MRGSKADPGAGYSSPAYLGRGWMRGGVKQTSGAGYSPPAYLGRGWIRGSKANYRCMLQSSCLLRQRLD